VEGLIGRFCWIEDVRCHFDDLVDVSIDRLIVCCEMTFLDESLCSITTSI